MLFRLIFDKDSKEDLDEEQRFAVETIRVMVADVAASDASKLLIWFNSKYPLPSSLEHVKRIWRRTLADGGIKLSIIILPKSIFDESEFELRKDFLGEPYECTVPARSPKSRQEYEYWRAKSYWPTVFHETDKATLKSRAEMLLNIEKAAQTCIPRLLETNDDLALIIDPTKMEIKTEACSTAGILDHAVMRAIERVACNQKEIVPKPLEKIPYLCTGYYAFCKKEPCLMCSMALIHARISAVIFIEPNLTRGALLSCLALQAVPQTNHHFSVYQVIP